MTGDFDLDRAVPWGRNRVEYLAFFDLLDLAPGTRILDCGAEGYACEVRPVARVFQKGGNEMLRTTRSEGEINPRTRSGRPGG